MALMPQRLAERDGGVNPSECPNSNREVIHSRNLPRPAIAPGHPTEEVGVPGVRGSRCAHAGRTRESPGGTGAWFRTKWVSQSSGR